MILVNSADNMRESIIDVDGETVVCEIDDSGVIDEEILTESGHVQFRVDGYFKRRLAEAATYVVRKWNLERVERGG